MSFDFCAGKPVGTVSRLTSSSLFHWRNIHLGYERRWGFETWYPSLSCLRSQYRSGEVAGLILQSRDPSAKEYLIAWNPYGRLYRAQKFRRVWQKSVRGWNAGNTRTLTLRPINEQFSKMSQAPDTDSDKRTESISVVYTFGLPISCFCWMDVIRWALIDWRAEPASLRRENLRVSSTRCFQRSKPRTWGV